MAGLNKAKGRQSSRHANRYKAQFFKTDANKARRLARRARKAAKRKEWNIAKRAKHLAELEAKRLAKNAKVIEPPLDPLPGPPPQ